MAISTRTYPSTQIEILDGNLTTSTTLPTDVVVIVGKAYKGPSNALYNVTSTKDAGLAFGSDSPIIKQMQMALAGGAQNVALFRIGGRQSVINNVFGTGSSIATTEASSAADSNLKVFIGPEPLTPNRDAIIVTRNDQIVYSNVSGGEVDKGFVVQEGFSKTSNTLYAGSFYDPVPFKQVANEIGHRVVVSGIDTPTITLPTYSAATASQFGFTVLVNGKRTSLFTLTTNVVTLNPAFVATLTSYTVEVSYIEKLTAQEIADEEIEYVVGQDLISSTWKQYYEAFDTALRELTLVNTRAVVMGDVFNVPNITNGSTEADRLEYVYIEEQEDSSYKYEWSTSRTVYQKGSNSTTTDVLEADLTSNGEPIVLKQFNDVDFTHRAGMWGFERTLENGFFPNIVVGAIGPANYTAKYVNQWIGKLPTYSPTGAIVANGTGLLGNRYMVGSLETGEGGYYATSTGHPNGTPLSDSGGASVDLGKYLSIVISQVISNAGNATEVMSGAASYAGAIANIQLGDGTTNTDVRGAINVVDFKVNRLKDFNNVGYVAFVEKTKGLSVLSGSLATRRASDFKYVGTTVVLNRVTQDIFDICDPFIGKGIDGILMVALHGALTGKLSQRQAEGCFSKYRMKMTQIGPNTIKVYYKITTKDELRVISNEIMLDRDLISTAIGD